MLINVRGKEASGILWLEQNIFSNETSQNINTFSFIAGKTP